MREESKHGKKFGILHLKIKLNLSIMKFSRCLYIKEIWDESGNLVYLTLDTFCYCRGWNNLTDNFNDWNKMLSHLVNKRSITNSIMSFVLNMAQNGVLYN